MNLKKGMVLLLVWVVAVLSLAGCSKTETDTADSGEAAQTAETASEPEEAKIFARVNGQKVYIGLLFADIKDSLGDEIKPSDEILPCGDGAGDWKRIQHYYPGMYIMEDQDGIICEISMSKMHDGECEALVNDQIKLGDSIAALKELLGTEPVQEDEYGFTSKFGEAVIQVSAWEEGSDEIYYIGILRGADYGW